MRAFSRARAPAQHGISAEFQCQMNAYMSLKVYVNFGGYEFHCKHIRDMILFSIDLANALIYVYVKILYYASENVSII